MTGGVWIIEDELYLEFLLTSQKNIGIFQIYVRDILKSLNIVFC